MRIKTEIDYLIIWKNLHGLADQQEHASFKQWLQSSKKNREYYEQLQKNYHRDKLEISPRDIEKSWSKVQEKLAPVNKKSLRRVFHVY